MAVEASIVLVLRPNELAKKKEKFKEVGGWVGVWVGRWVGGWVRGWESFVRCRWVGAKQVFLRIEVFSFSGLSVFVVVFVVRAVGRREYVPALPLMVVPLFLGVTVCSQHTQ